MALIDDIRKAVRVSPVPVEDAGGLSPDDAAWEPTYGSDFDDELQDLIDAALADMLRAGVRPALLDADAPGKLVKMGVKLYAKAHFGYDNQERSEFIASYERVLVDLKNATWSNVEFWRVPMTDCTVADIPAQPYTGATVRPVPDVVHDGQPLELGRDFRVSYAGNVGPGTASVFVHGTGSYMGTVEAAFEIAGA